jgi:hypothetical protein
MRKKSEVKAADKKTYITKHYARLAKKLKRDLRMQDLQDVGITRDMISHHFGSLTLLEKNARDEYPDNFFDVTVESIYSPKAIADLREEVASSKRFVVTTAVNGCEVHPKFLASIKNYCKLNNASLLILVASDPAASRDKAWGTISSKLKDETIVLEDTRLNSNVFLSTIKLSAKHIDPTTGLGRIGQRNGTFIYASPKQRLKAVPVSNSSLPHFMMTTGAITVANYNSELYMSQRTAYIAEHDHVLGAVVVEIVDDKRYHFRQIQSDSRGNFYDLGKKYSPTECATVQPEAFVLGDWHAGSTDPAAKKAWFEISQLTRPKRILLHDAFDGISINHHEKNYKLLKAKRAESNQLSLQNELEILANDIQEIATLTNEVVVVKSNHDQFLERYLQEAKYVDDPQNHRIALQLALQILDGNDPLRYAVSDMLVLDAKTKSKVKWLSIDNDYRIEGIQCGAHGHLGANGSRGSIEAMETAYGYSVTGHSHTPQILRGAWCVGTSSLLKLDYNKGVSSWLHSSCLIYPGGSRQLINCIDGQWRLGDLAKTTRRKP